MTKDQFKYIVAALTSNYSRFEIKNQAQFEFWYSMLNDIPYDQLIIAVKKYCAENKFAPTVADLREAFVSVKESPVLDHNEAWGLIQRAIRNFGVYRPEEAIASLPPTVARVMKNMNYKELCMSENQMADRAHFIKMYTAFVGREQKDKQIPGPLKEEVEMIQQGVKLLAKKMDLNDL